MSSSGLSIVIHIVAMFCKSFPQTSTGLPNVLLPAPINSAADGIADVLAVAVQLGIQVHPVVGCCRPELFSSLDIWTGWTVSLSTFDIPFTTLLGLSAGFGGTLALTSFDLRLGDSVGN